MKITRTSQATGVTRTLDLTLTPEELAAWQRGELIQNAAPHLSDADREFILTGITAEEWIALFGTDDEDVPAS